MTSQINFDDFNRAIIIRFLILLERKIRYLNNRLDIMEIVEINRVMNSENFNSKLLHVLTDLILRFTGLRRQLIAFQNLKLNLAFLSESLIVFGIHAVQGYS